MVLENQLISSIQHALKELYGHEAEINSISLQTTRKEFDGQLTFIVFPYARISRKSPPETATEIGNYLQTKSEIVGSFNVVKGFLNISIKEEVWKERYRVILEDQDYGRGEKKGQKVMVEFSSPNTNKPLHLGHLRNNFLGQSVSNLLEFQGHEVLKVNLINDRGIHICKSMVAYQEFGNQETPETARMKGDHLVGKYYVIFDQQYKKEVAQLEEQGVPKDQAEKEASLMIRAKETLQKWEENDPETVELWKLMNGWVYEGFEQTYAYMGVEFDQVFYESQTYLLGKNMVEEGLGKGVFFRKDDGSVWADLQEEGLDEKLLLRSDGTSVYMTQDLGTADMKYDHFKFDQSLYVVGNEQDYHFKVLFTLLRKLGREYADGLYHLSYGMVDLPSGKMKSREGTVVDADDLMTQMEETARAKTEELGKIEGFSDQEAGELYRVLGLGAVKYFLLKVDPKSRMLFNPEESIEFQGNTGPFIQYTHARISAIRRKAKEQHVAYEQALPLVEKLERAEQELITLLNDYPRRLANAAEEYSPAQVAQYAFDLAKEYNKFYGELPILSAEIPEKIQLRVGLSHLVGRTLRSAMGILGIDCPERM